MKDRILAFLQAIDNDLATGLPAGEIPDLYIIGKAAIILFYDGHLSGAMTSDVDLVTIGYPPTQALQTILTRFGKDSPARKVHDLYLEAVPDVIPPLAGAFRRRCVRFVQTWQYIRVWQPDANDLATSKLKRFATKDREDIKHLCDNGFVQEDKLRQSLDEAYLWETEETGDPDRESAFANLDKVLAYLRGERRDL